MYTLHVIVFVLLVCIELFIIVLKYAIRRDILCRMFYVLLTDTVLDDARLQAERERV